MATANKAATLKYCQRCKRFAIRRQSAPADQVPIASPLLLPTLIGCDIVATARPEVETKPEP